MKMDEIVIDGVIGSWEVEAKEVIYQLNECKGDVTIKLNSVGGSVIDGITIYNALREYNKGTVIVEIGAVAASIASYIALGGDVIKAHSNSTYMIHLAWLPVMGNYVELRKAADISEGLSSIIANAYVAKTKMEKSDAIDLMTKETFYYGDEMLNAKFVDEIIDIESNTNKAEALSITLESLKACNNAIHEHETLSYEAVAKILPKKEVIAKVEKTKVVDLSAQQQRQRSLDIKKRY